jgi:hypothetical protein
MRGSLVLIETAGNQRFIFATNKLAENLGASQMIWRVGVEFVLDAVTKLTGRKIFDLDPVITRGNLLNAHLNPPLADGEPGIEIITASSGKALLIVGSREIGKAIVSEVTRRALAEAPGVEVRGFVGPEIDLEGTDPDTEIRRVHQGITGLRGEIPGPEFRFLRLPIVAPCATSGFPASHENQRDLDYREAQPDSGLRSEISFAKRRQVDLAILRMHGSLAMEAVRLPRNTFELEALQTGQKSVRGALTVAHTSPLEWLAVVHADGNGLGKIFMNFGRKAGAQRDWRRCVSAMRAFSLGLDACTEAATRTALQKSFERKESSDQFLAALPLVMGGDDLTLVCDGRIAVRLTHEFLDCFQKETAKCEGVSSIVDNGLTASAGVAIVKPHFPFHLAYELAEALLKSAKKRKPASALDFHVHYDASGGDLEPIRSRLYLDAGSTRLLSRPYTVDCGAWRCLEEAVTRLRSDSENDEPATASSILHELREAVFLGRDAGEQRLQWLLKRRGPGDGLSRLLADLHGAPTLFREVRDGRVVHETALLDLLEIQEFWQ